MPPLVGIAIAAGSAALGVGGVIAGAATGLASAIGIADATAVIVGDVAAGAVVGAASGVGTALAAGTDPGDGALFGAVTGGLTAGLTPAVADVTGLSTETSQAIASGVVTTGAALVQGAPVDKALEAGAVAGAANYAGSEIFGSGQPSQPSTPGSQSQTPNVDNGGETVTVTGVHQGGSAADIGPSLVAGQGGQSGNVASETAVVTAPKISSPNQTDIQVGAGGPHEETIHVTGQKQGNTTVSAPSILDQIQANPGTQTLEKGVLEAALFQLLFPTGGSSSQFNPTGGASTVSTSAGTGAGGVGAIGGAGSASGGAASGISPAALAAMLSQSGQAGSTSAYAPGGPIFGEPPGASKYTPWNVESLRTGAA